MEHSECVEPGNALQKYEKSSTVLPLTLHLESECGGYLANLVSSRKLARVSRINNSHDSSCDVGGRAPFKGITPYKQVIRRSIGRERHIGM